VVKTGVGRAADWRRSASGHFPGGDLVDASWRASESRHLASTSEHGVTVPPYEAGRTALLETTGFTFIVCSVYVYFYVLHDT